MLRLAMHTMKSQFRPSSVVSSHISSVSRCGVTISPKNARLRLLGSSRGLMLISRAASIEKAATPTASGSPTSPVAMSTNGASNGTKKALTFQEAIQRLQDYWSSVGCAVWLPHNTEVGAGTMNPATFLRVLGPEPWNVAYAEPSIRPDDSRYGDNPNRLQRHTQYQVILKPDPGNSQELFLGSLEALGIDTKKHDVRFVEDNWESPALGAWGLGWEVWLDGMEVTQFTYFQQAGGRPLENVAVEITYGLERIVMALQGVTNFRDIAYNDKVKYGEMFLQNEYEMSVYNLEEADIEDQRLRSQLFEREAKRMIEKRLPIPAYDHLLKVSHAFNILDARGAIGVTERANCFAVMRNLARECAKLWAERREELGYPLGAVPPVEALTSLKPVVKDTSGAARKLVVEVGTEELPPDEVDSAIAQLTTAVPALLAKLRLSHGAVRVEGTPRRLAVVVDAVAAAQPDLKEEVRGPPSSSAYDAEGKPSKALEGFMKKNGVTEKDLTRAPGPKNVEYVFATVQQKGRPAAEVLTEELGGLVSGLGFRKSMRWNSDAAFSRPLRWLCALHGDTVLPFHYATVRASNATRVLRNDAQPERTIASAESYEADLKAAGIVLSVADRRAQIWSAVQQMAQAQGGYVPESAKGDLLAEVSNLVEAPTMVMGGFDAAFLELPDEVLVMVMRKHQRYFPVYSSATQRLLPFFITAANGPIDPPTVQEGNEAVLRARFSDARFFYYEDLKQKLADFRPALSGTLFQKDLGSMLDKSRRAEQLVAPLAKLMGLEGAQATAAQAAALFKNDLATSMVMEMTALHGTMGRHYAQKEGIEEAVATAVFEAVLPRSADDIVPATPAGTLVSVADKVDSLVGLFAAGCEPTASADPYGLRRTAYGLLQALLANNVRLDLPSAIAAAAAVQPLTVADKTRADVNEFLMRRLEQLLVDRGVAVEPVRAVLSERGNDPCLAASTAAELSAEMRENADRFNRIMAAYARPVRIMRGKEKEAQGAVVDEALFENDQERNLWKAYQEVKGRVQAGVAVPAFLEASEALVQPVADFFDKVFVMAENLEVRKNRLALLREVAALPRGVVNFAELPGF